MGKIVTIEYVDDLEGTSIDAESVDTIEFSYRGQDYTLVLTRDNGAQFDKDVARYIDAAKKARTREARATRKSVKRAPKQKKTPSKTTGQRTKTKPAALTASGAERTRSIRKWAIENGHNVSDRGRIPAAVLEAFETAH